MLRFLVPILLAALAALAACASTTALPKAPARRNYSPDLVQIARFLADQDAAEIRAFFEADLEELEIQHVGFDEVTLAQCVDRVVAAARATRERPGDQRPRDELLASVDEALAAQREAHVRRSIGKAGCLPPIR